MENSTPSWPTVSVHVVSCKGRAAKLARALQSVLEQTYKDYEVLVITDGESDEATMEVLGEFEQRFTDAGVDFKAGHIEESGYYTLARNVATFYSRGDYVAPLDDDNAWTSDHLQVLVDAAEEGEVWPDLVYGRREYVLEDECPREFHGATLREGVSEYVPWNEFAKLRLDKASGNFIDSGDMLYTRGGLYWLAMTTKHMWNEDTRRFGDWDLVARAAYFGGWRFKDVDHVVQTYYLHGANVSLTRPVQETPQAVNLNE